MTPVLRPAVFLDRDGVINRSIVRNGQPYPPSTVNEFEILPGVPEACDLLRQAGLLLVVATNQPDVGRGTQQAATVDSMHALLRARIAVDRIEVCCDPHDSPDSYRRKPKPGMLLDAARDLHLDLAASFMVGDRWRDVDCGQAAGCTTVFIDLGYNEELRATPDLLARDLPDAARQIVALHQSRSTSGSTSRSN